MDRLIVDLRGNGGDNLAMALSFRDRFVARPAGRGRFGPPSREGRSGRRFLTDARTYSASEDALLGVQGTPHVEVVGRPSGGGSGRMRRVRLVPGWVLTVATALTWDRNQRGIEGRGIPVDRYLPWSDPNVADPVDAWMDRW